MKFLQTDGNIYSEQNGTENKNMPHSSSAFCRLHSRVSKGDNRQQYTERNSTHPYAGTK